MGIKKKLERESKEIIIGFGFGWFGGKRGKKKRD